MDSRIREDIKTIDDTLALFPGAGDTRDAFARIKALLAAEPKPCEDAQYSYASKQRTACAVCGDIKHTPLRRDEMGGYVCLACIDERLDDYDVSEKILDEIKKRDAHIKQIIMWAEGCIDEAHTPDFVELSHVIESSNSALYHNTDQFEHEWDALTKEEMWNEIQDIRRLVDSDGTKSICSDIEAYASQVADKREEELRAQVEKLREFVAEAVEWSEAYPTHLWPEPTPNQVDTVCRSLGFRIDRIAAMVLRGYTMRWSEKAKALLATTEPKPFTEDPETCQCEYHKACRGEVKP